MNPETSSSVVKKVDRQEAEDREKEQLLEEMSKGEADIFN